MRVKIENMEPLVYAKREAFNSLQTNLSFCGDNNHVILVTSTAANEGKSSIVMRLGIEMGANNKKVLVIDADLRKSVLVGRHFVTSEGGEEIKGLSHYLSGQVKLENAICQTNFKNFDIIFAGHTTPKPTELLRNDYFKKLIEYGREHYDIVLIDTAPLGMVIDAAAICPLVDGAMLVIESGKFSYKQIVDVKKQLVASGVNILGVVISKFPVGGSKSYYSKYYYSKYGRYGKYGKYGRYGKYGTYDRYGQYGMYGQYGRDE